MLDVFRHVRSDELHGLIVWVPMVPGDSALEAANLLSREKRFHLQGWDSQLSVGEELAKTLKLKVPAWDVYLVYKPGVRWDTGPAPMPTFWMHQLGHHSGADPALHLQPHILENEVRQELANREKEPAFSTRDQ